MWWLYALLSAVFAAATSILAKVGIENVNSHLATAVRTVVVVGMAWIMVFITDSQGGLYEYQPKKLDISYTFGSCHGCVVAVLLPRLAAWRCLQGGAR